MTRKVRAATVPVALPPNWVAETNPCGVVITAYDSEKHSQGSVTVCTKVRGYSLGITRVYAGEGEKRYLAGR